MQAIFIDAKFAYRTLTVLVALFLCCVVTAGANAASPSTIDQAELMTRIEQGNAPLILDVRTAGEYAQGHIPGAKNIQHRELADSIDLIAEHRPNEVVVYCEAGPRANYAEHVLRQAGFKNIRNLDGHMSAWRKSGLQIEN